MLKMITKFNQFINENNYNNTIVCCDIQLDYENYINFNIQSWVNYINKNQNKTIIFLFNGPDLGYADENLQKDWLFSLGIKENIINKMIFYDKGYGFFRDAIDNGVSSEDLVYLIKFMKDNDINCSGLDYMDSEMWNKFISEYNVNKEDYKKLIESDYCSINIPDVMDFLDNYNNIILMGGGRDECLKEVEIILDTLDKNYQTLEEFIY